MITFLLQGGKQSQVATSVLSLSFSASADLWVYFYKAPTIVLSGTWRAPFILWYWGLCKKPFIPFGWLTLTHEEPTRSRASDRHQASYTETGIQDQRGQEIRASVRAAGPGNGMGTRLEIKAWSAAIQAVISMSCRISTSVMLPFRCQCPKY